MKNYIPSIFLTAAILLVPLLASCVKLPQFPDTPEGNYEKALYYLNQLNFKIAAKAIDRAIEQDPDFAKAQELKNYIGWSAMPKKNLIEFFDRELTIGRALLIGGKPELAERHLRKALAFDINALKEWERKKQEAIPIPIPVVKTGLNQGRIDLAQALVNQKKYKEALHFLQEVNKQAPYDERVFYYYSGFAEMLLGNHDKALENFTEARKTTRTIGISDRHILVMEAATYGLKKDYAKMEEILKDVLSRFPMYEVAWDALGQFYQNVEDEKFHNLDKAIDAYEKAVQFGSTNPLYHSTLADAYFEAGRTDEAIQAIKKAIELAPDNEEHKKQLEKYQNAEDKKEAK